jgi:YbgC/YbaW family acyl-CoA thioester hydrolase
MASMKRYTREIRISFHEADPAGVLFFGHILSMAHSTFEEFLRHAGFTYREWFQNQDFMIPIRHCESDYSGPLFPGEFYMVDSFVQKLGQTSFQMKYLFRKDENICAEVSMVHAFMDAKTRQKITIPHSVRQRLMPFVADSDL